MQQIAQEIALVLREMIEVLKPSVLDWLTLVIATGSLILLGYYAYYTKRIASANEGLLGENLRPIVSCELKSGKSYYSSQQIKQSPNLKYDTRCIVRNQSRYNVVAFVNLNLSINGKLEEIADVYSGKKEWPLTSFQGINGHFDPSAKFNMASVTEMSIKLEVSYKSDVGILYKNPTQYWYFDFSDEMWKNDIGLAV